MYIRYYIYNYIIYIIYIILYIILYIYIYRQTKKLSYCWGLPHHRSFNPYLSVGDPPDHQTTAGSKPRDRPGLSLKIAGIFQEMYPEIYGKSMKIDPSTIRICSLFKSVLNHEFPHV